MLTRISKNTRGGSYRVSFEDRKTLVDFACENSKNKNIVTILPGRDLSDEQEERLKEANAQVIFLDVWDVVELNDIRQISGIVFAGMSYLNEDSNALTEILKILLNHEYHVDLKEFKFVDINELKKHPEKYPFMLLPIEIHDHDEIRRLNDLMEKVITAA